MMNKEFIPHNLSLELKNLGFNEECFAWWSTLYNKPALYFNTFTNTELSAINKLPQNCIAPLWQQAFEFFRTQKELHCVIYDVFDKNDKLLWDFDIIDNNSEEEEYDIPLSETYEEARLKCLTKLIEIAK